MKHLDEYRDGATAARLGAAIRAAASRPWTLMEVCGGQTRAIVKHGIDALLPDTVELVHGPGCPVCVTPLELIDRAHRLAARPEVIFCSFGDMLRVPGSEGDLLQVKAQGGDVRVVYSPLDAVSVAAAHPDRAVVFFAIGFETTAPATAMAIRVAQRRGIANFSVLVSHVLVPPAMEAILQAPDNRVQAFLGPGHVCTVTGLAAYEALAQRHRVPIVITGFQPLDLLAGVLAAVRQLERGTAAVDNQYARVVRAAGNRPSQQLVNEIFAVCDRPWRGIGVIPHSGLQLRPGYAAYDAERRFPVSGIIGHEPAVCISGQILRGTRKPPDCPAFATACTPESPLGATMVSSEGACAAYYRYGRARLPARPPAQAAADR